MVDVLRFAAGVPYAEFLDFALVRPAIHQLGFLRADGMIRRPARATRPHSWRSA